MRACQSLKGVIILIACIPHYLFGINKPRPFNAPVDDRRVFIENIGQFHSSDISASKDSVLFAYIGSAEKYYFTKSGVIVEWNEKVEKHNPAVFLQKKFYPEETLEEMEREGEFLKNKQYLLQARWNGIQADVHIVPGNKVDHYYTFGHLDGKASAYETLTYMGIYPNIDIEYIIPHDKSGIKYNLILHLGAIPDDIELEYSGDIKDIIQDANGNIQIFSNSENFSLLEHKPESFYETAKTSIDSYFILHEKKKIKFELPGVSVANETIVIDPWVMPVDLAANGLNIAYDVDYDAERNLFVYVVAGSDSDFYICKYDNATGALLWTHDVTYSSYTGNFLVEKNTGRVYVSEAFEPSNGATIYRLDASGVADGFVSIPNVTANEFWNIGFNCADGGSILALGGGTSSNLSGGIVNTTTGAISIQNFTGQPGGYQDIVSFAFDNQGRLFTLFASGNVTAVNNKIIRVNSSLNGPVYNVPSGYNSFDESYNHLFDAANQFNAIAVNDSYLVYYDGKNLKAFNPNTGVALGSISLAAHTVKGQGGIAIDDCDNVFIGGKFGNILYYSFDGSNFSLLGDLSLGWTGTSKYVMDVVYDRSTNMLFVSGKGNASIVESPTALGCTGLLNVTGNCPLSNNGTSTATLTAATANALMTYTWKDANGIILSQTINTSSATNTVTGLSSGDYTVTVQLNAPCGPEFAANITIDCPACSISAVSNPVTCYGLSDGTATVDAYTGVEPVDIVWSTIPVQNTSAATNLHAGNYTVTITDAEGCLGSADVTVAEPQQLITTIIAFENVACFGGDNGTATNSTSGGTEPYAYAWNTAIPQNSVTAIGLMAGDYTVDVTDANGCISNSAVNISQPTPLMANIVGAVQVLCFGDNSGIAAAAINGGIPPYDYEWNTTPVQHNLTITDLSVGSYEFAVHDANGCFSSTTAMITQPPPLNVSIENTMDVLCNGENTGSALGAVTGGAGAYVYIWNTIPVQHTLEAIQLVEGAYTLSVVDANGCVADIDVSIGEPPSLAITIVNSTNVLCHGENSGDALASASGGIEPYEISWNTTPLQDTEMANNLSVGGYTASANDANGCTVSTVVDITEPSALVATIISSIDILCFGENTGSATAEASGGIPPYNYSWNNIPQSYSASLNSLMADEYEVTIGDANGCIASAEVEIHQPLLLSANITAFSDVLCYGGNTGSAEASAQGGTLPYAFSWNTPIVQNNLNANNLTSGNYIVTVQDAHGCVADADLDISQPSLLSMNVTHQNVTCAILCDGQITSMVQGGSQPYVISYTTNDTVLSPPNFIMNNVCTGDYEILVIDDNGCQISQQIEVTGPPAITITGVSTTPQECAIECNGSITIGAINGLEYSIDGGLFFQTSNHFDQLCAGNYDVVVSGLNDCEITSSTTIEQLVTPVSDFDFSPTTATSAHPLFEFNNLSQNANEYHWDFAGFETSHELNPSYSFPNYPVGEFIVCLDASNFLGCSDTHCETITIKEECAFYVPNAFTPATDGLNDLFIPVMNCKSPFIYSFMIFNRWGELIFETTNPKLGWNGGYGTTYCQPDAYVWKVDVQYGPDEEIFLYTGNVILLR